MTATPIKLYDDKSELGRMQKNTLLKNVKQEKLDNEWISESKYGDIKLKGMITDFLRHFQLHLGEIQELIDQ